MRLAARQSLLGAAVAALMFVGGCGDDVEAPTAGDAGQRTIQVTFADGDVTPKGDRVTIDAGTPVTFEITADEPGEMHVHSSPEQEFAYESGTHSYEVTIDTPGVVDIEAHHPEVVVVQLEVQ